MSATIALTGATGFIGSTLARRLAATGWRVRALIRPQAAEREGLEIAERVAGTLEDPAALARLVDGAEAIVHCAGAVRGATAERFGSVNVDGVVRLIEAASAGRASPRFLLMSSLAASEPDLSPYAASKRAGERALADAGGDLPWTVFRPPAVYGPGDRELLPLFRLLSHGIAPAWTTAEARFALLFVEDLAEAVACWLACAGGARQIFELHDGRAGGYDRDAVVAAAEAVFQRKIRSLKVPGRVLDVVAAANLRAARLLGYDPMLTPGKLRELRHPRWLCDNAPLTRTTGWRPRVELEEGLRRTLGSAAARDPGAG